MVTAGSLSVSKGGIHLAKKTKKAAPQSRETAGIKSFLDMIAPSVVKFEPDHFICGNTFRCVWALREYPTQTDEQAILRHLGEKDGITLRIYTRQVTPAEEKRIIQNAANKNRMGRSNTNDLQQTITAESNLQDVASLVASMHRNREPLLHCAVYIELTASDYNTLKLLQTDVLTELVRSKLNVDRLLLRQQQGFCCASPVGYNAFGQQFERVLPASSVANLYPFNYSGKTDAKGFYVGRDKYGSNILVDFDQRDEDKTSANILILGNSGQGKSYLMKLLILNLLESGKSVITLDAEHEQQEMCEAVGGCFADLIIVPSKWLAGVVKQSFLKEYPVEVLHNQIDKSLFKPTPSGFRKQYGLDGKTVILGAASVWDKEKGLLDFCRLREKLDSGFAIVLVGVTEKQKRKLLPGILALPRTANPGELAGNIQCGRRVR